MMAAKTFREWYAFFGGEEMAVSRDEAEVVWKAAIKSLEGVQTQSGGAPNQQLKAEIAALITEYVTDIERGELHKMALFISKLRQLSAV